MIPLSRARFTLDAPYLGEADLENYALDLFHRFDSIASQLLPLPDYALRLELDEGSLKGCGRVLATAGAIYLGVGQFGSFVQGLREIGALGRRVADKLVQESPRPLHLPRERILWARRDSATIGQLERLFRRVKAGEIEPEAATEEAVRLLSADGDVLPPQFVADMTAAVGDIRRDWKQLEMPLETLVRDTPDEQPPLPPSARLPIAHEAAPPRRRLHVEIYRSSKDGDELISIVPLE